MIRFITNSSDDDDYIGFNSICKICGSEYCYEDDCEKYINPNFFKDVFDCLGVNDPNQFHQKKKFIPKNHKRRQYNKLYELGCTLGRNK